MFGGGRSWRLFLVCAMAVTGCHRAIQPSGPLAGTWSGSVSDNANGMGSMRLVLEQTGLALTGTLRMAFQGAPGRDGAVVGTVIGAGTSGSLSQTAGGSTVCANGLVASDTLTLTVTAANGRLTGSYLGFACFGLTGGTFDLGAGP